MSETVCVNFSCWNAISGENLSELALTTSENVFGRESAARTIIKSNKNEIKLESSHICTRCFLHMRIFIHLFLFSSTILFADTPAILTQQMLIIIRKARCFGRKSLEKKIVGGDHLFVLHTYKNDKYFACWIITFDLAANFIYFETTFNSELNTYEVNLDTGHEAVDINGEITYLFGWLSLAYVRFFRNGNEVFRYDAKNIKTHNADFFSLTALIERCKLVKNVRKNCLQPKLEYIAYIMRANGSPLFIFKQIEHRIIKWKAIQVRVFNFIEDEIVEDLLENESYCSFMANASTKVLIGIFLISMLVMFFCYNA